MDMREDLVRHYRWLRQYGINDSHSGNVSVRDGDRVWITPRGACADLLQARDLVPMALHAPPPPQASLDAPLHLAVYLRNPQFRAVIHSHGAHTVAMTLDGRAFVPVDFEGQLYFPQAPVLEIAYGRYLEESPERVAAALADGPIVIVRGHGAYAAASDLDRAYKWTCSLELSARTAWLARLAGTLPD